MKAGWSTPRLLMLLVMLAIALPSRTTRAGACCMSATAFGMGRLLAGERLAVGLRSSMAFGLGSWNTDRRWRFYSDNYSEREWRSELWTMIALGKRASIYGRLPVMLSYRRAGNLGDDTGGGVADIQAGARYEALSIGEHRWLPAVAFSVVVGFPTGRAMDGAIQDGDRLGATVTGRGAWTLGAGISVEKTFTPWFVRTDLGVTVPLPASREDTGKSQRFGPGVQIAVAGGRAIVHDFLVSVIARLSWEGPVTIDGHTVDESAKTETAVGLAFSWRLAPRWTVQAGVDTSLFVNSLGDNQPGRLTTTLGLRYGHY